MEFFVIPESSDSFTDIITHLRGAFFRDEPLNKSVSLCGVDEGHPQLERQSLDSLKEGKSVIAISDDKKIAGVCINGIIRRGDIEKSLVNVKSLTTDPNYQAIFQFLYEENLKLDLFNRFGVDDIFELRILSVDPKYRGRSVGKGLIELSMKIAKESGIKVVKTDATSFFSQKIVKSFDFSSAAEISYAQHLNSNGKPIFNVEMPHESLKIMYKLLGEENYNQC